VSLFKKFRVANYTQPYNTPHNFKKEKAMTTPAILFAFALALLLGATYHFFRNGGAWHLVVYLLASALGFLAGQLVGLWRGWILLKLGPLNLGMEILGGLLFLAIADWFLHLEPRAREEEEKP
jgi:hypothetical protein